MTVQPVDRELSPLDCYTPHKPGARYGYRGTVIVGIADGWNVYEGDRPMDADFAEIGWGSDMFDAMQVANEHVDGCERMPVRRAA